MTRRRKRAETAGRPAGNRESLPDGIRLEQRLVSAGRRFTSLAWSPDGQSLVAGTEAGTVELWTNSQGMMQEGTSWNTDLNGVFALSWAPDSHRLIVGGKGPGLTVLDKKQIQPITHLRSTVGETVFAVAWSQDDSMIAVGQDIGSIRLIDVQTGRSRWTLDGHGTFNPCVAWRADGSLLASASADGTAAIWDVTAGRILCRLSGHSAMVLCVAWLPDGYRVVTGGCDRSLRFWNAGSGEQLIVVEGHSNDVYCVSVISDGELLASYGLDAIRIWRLDTYELVGISQQE